MPHIDILAIQPACQQTFEPQLSPLLQSALDEVEKIIVDYVSANQQSQNHAARLASS
ncbi:hypothetical protein [Enterovibrio coralii]|nr:hypothetical protein [Enterovibrio coralii]